MSIGSHGRLPLGVKGEVRLARVGSEFERGDCRRRALIEAPIEVVWALVRDVNRHPEWWPRVVDVECEGLEEGCTYRQVGESPFGYQELDVVVDRPDELRELRIRCPETGTFVDLSLTLAGGRGRLWTLASGWIR
jgi:Polyketide cyclase / dehydrase and lipid transport